MASFDPLWGNPMKHTQTVIHGGHEPIPGTTDALQQGCYCPGKIGQLDRWGRPGGFTVDNDCPHHGREARSHNRQTQIPDGCYD